MSRSHPAASEDESGQEPEKGVSLNFKVSPEFKKEFKGYAVAEGISMTDLLKDGFALSKNRRQK
ncbi:MAG: hypothetical protein KJ872_12300 [Alphaproteobacteria bacterium]|nr:hypothetical protein [Alphaproteobacteria bacterium]